MQTSNNTIKRLNIAVNLVRLTGYIWGAVMFLDALFKQEIKAADWGLWYLYVKLAILCIGTLIILLYIRLKRQAKYLNKKNIRPSMFSGKLYRISCGITAAYIIAYSLFLNDLSVWFSYLACAIVAAFLCILLALFIVSKRTSETPNHDPSPQDNHNIPIG